MNAIHSTISPNPFKFTFPSNQIRNIDHNLRNQNEFLNPGVKLNTFKTAKQQFDDFAKHEIFVKFQINFANFFLFIKYFFKN